MLSVGGINREKNRKGSEFSDKRNYPSGKEIKRGGRKIARCKTLPQTLNSQDRGISEGILREKEVKTSGFEG